MTVIFLDFDDCIFPTHAITQLMLQNKLSSMSELQQFHHLFADLEGIVIKAIQGMLLFSHVHIVTNATDGWVDYICKIVMPRLWTDVIQDLPISYARAGIKSAQFQSNPFTYKYEAFVKLCDFYKPIQVISIGDSCLERMAVLSLPHDTKKSIKLLDTPSVQDLQMQWYEIIGKCEHIFKHDKSFDVLAQRETPERILIELM